MRSKVNLIAILTLVIGVIFTLTSCQKDMIQNLKSALTVVMDKGTESLLKSQRAITVDSGYIYVTTVEIYGEIEDESSDDHYNDNDDSKDEDDHYDNHSSDDLHFYTSVQVNTLINLLTGAYEVPIEFDITENVYDDLKIIINLNSSATDPAINIYGTYFDVNGNPVAVRFIYRDSISIKAEYDRDDDDYDHDLIVMDSVPAFVIHVSPSKWFKDVSSSMLENAVRYDGVIVISDTSNVEIFNKIVPNIGKECYMHEEDRDHFDDNYHREDMHHDDDDDDDDH